MGGKRQGSGGCKRSHGFEKCVAAHDVSLMFN
jgi:hypothetical protein